MSEKSTNPRWLALKAVLLVVQRGRSLDDALKTVLGELSNVDERDLALCRALSYGVCRWYLALQSIVAGYLKKPLRKKDQDVEIILLLGLYQLLLMRTESHAAVNETVKLTLWQKKSWAKGLVNAVLRGVARDDLQLQSSSETDSYPNWIAQKLALDWPQNCDAILAAGNQQAPMVLRVDLCQMSRDDAVKSLKLQGLEAQTHEFVETAVVLKQPCNVLQIEGFTTGIFSVQDAAAQLAASLLDCQPGMRVLDACAAPGGKTAHILQATDLLQVTALDQDQKRLALVAENLQRTGRNATLRCGDASQPEDWFDGEPFDRILADVPCSASGVIRRHPDIKLLRRASDIEVLVAQQRSILLALWKLLKPGGKMLYSTCSIFKDENERQIKWFVQQVDNCTVTGPNSVQWGELRPWGRQILPGSQDMDGFYYASLQKTAAEA